MITVPRHEHKVLIAIHGWSGIMLGLLLLVIIATGTVAVMGEEIGLWSSGTTQTRSPLTQPLDANVKRVLDLVPRDKSRMVDLSAAASNRLQILAHGAPGPDEQGVYVEVAPDGRILRRVEGRTEDIRHSDPADALAQFLVDVHVRLYVPRPWGFLLTAAAGLAMLVAGISGIVIHRHLFKDIFTLRKGAQPVLANRDRHSVAGAWSLPFVFLLAFTGSYFSLIGSVGFPMLAWSYFGGDQQKLIATLRGTPPASNPALRTGADLDAIVADAAIRAGVEPRFIRIQHPGRSDAQVTVFHETLEGQLTRIVQDYDGVSGRFLRQRPPVGRVASLGGTVAGLMGPLHFGNFGGLASKLVWTALGFASCFVAVSGLRLWLARRDLSRRPWAIFDRAISVAAFGLPLAMATAAIAFFCALPAGTTVFWTAAGFIAGAAAAIVAGFALPRPQLDHTLRAATGICLVALPLLRLACGGPSWGNAFAHGQVTIVSGDIAVVLIGLAFGLAPWKQWLRSRRAAAGFRTVAAE